MENFKKFQTKGIAMKFLNNYFILSISTAVKKTVQ